MENFEFKGNILDPKYAPPLEKAIDRMKENAPLKEPEVMVEKGEEIDFHNALRKELKENQKGDVDIHFGQVDLDNLSNQALDLYEEYKRKNINFEKDLSQFRLKTAEGSDDYNFAAMLLNWHLADVLERKHRNKKEN